MELAPMMRDAYVLVRKDELDHLDVVLDGALRTLDSSALGALSPVAHDVVACVKSCLEDAHLTTMLLVNFAARVAHKDAGPHATFKAGRKGEGH